MVRIEHFLAIASLAAPTPIALQQLKTHES